MKKRPNDSKKFPVSTPAVAPAPGAPDRAALADLPARQPPALSSEEKCPFRQLVREWLDYCRSDGLSPRTIHDYREKIFKFWWWWSEHTRYAESLGAHPRFVTTREAREFAAYLRTPLAFRWGLPVPPPKQSLSPVSVSSYGRSVKVFFSWLEREGHIAQSPFNRSVRFTSRNKAGTVIKCVEEEELNRIFKELTRPENLKTYSGARDLAMLALLLDSGMRRGELLSMRLCDIDLRRNRAVIRGKTGERTSYFSDTCRIAVTDYLQHYRLEQDEEPGSALWLAEDGVPLSYGGFGMVVRRLEKRSGVDFHPHRLRHTFASQLARQGVNVFDLKEMLGHRSITTTQIYVQQNPDRLGEVHRAHSPLTALPAGQQLRRRGRPRSS